MADPVAKPCECGEKPTVAYMPDSILRLRCMACNKCRTSSVLRMHTSDAIEAWNAGQLVYKNGEYVYDSNAVQ